ncbi:MAG TPA: TerC family protein, partial [Rhodocyclaceae bacterium]|nr:TerC family protein [Rhodocyclaceae bacterium]
GGMLLGWIAGTMAQSDPALATFIPQDRAWHYGMGVVGALLVLALGKFLERRRASASAVT